MVFQPFGYRFDVRSPMSPDAAKAAIRARTTSWFDAKHGARGWIAGPLICLWFSAFDRYGPMLFGVISQDGLATRIRGRAGSDLNGMAMLALVLLALAAIAGLAAAQRQVGQVIPALVFVTVLIPLALWAAHTFRRDADPLVRFLENAVSPTDPAIKRRLAAVRITRPFKMDINGDSVSDPVTPESIYQALLRTGTDDFVVLEQAPEIYIQTASRDGVFVVEKRDGDHLHHYQATRNDGRDLLDRNLLTFDQALETLLAYVSDAPAPSWLDWEQMIMPANTDREA